MCDFYICLCFLATHCQFALTCRIDLFTIFIALFFLLPNQVSDPWHSSFSEIDKDNRSISSCSLPWHQLENAEIVVTGASGFLGGSIIRFLLSLYPSGLISSPLRVRGIIRSQNSILDSLSRYLGDKYFKLDICDFSTVDHISLGSPSYIIHAASHASPKYYSTDPIGILLSNSKGTHALLNAASSDTRFLYISSSEVYGFSSTNKSIAETDFGSLDPIKSRSCYSEAKRFGECLVTCLSTVWASYKYCSTISYLWSWPAR